MSPGRIITDEADLAEGAAWLAARHPAFARALARTGPLPLRRRPEGFAALLDIIVGQQVSTASAAAIWSRLDAAGLVERPAVDAAPLEALTACGLSRPKARHAKAIAADPAALKGLAELDDAALVARLVALPGIGPWSAQIYGMFALGRADMLAAGDLALQEAARRLFDLPARPDAATLDAMARDWSPWRAVAARTLWAYYRLERQREGIR